MKHTNLFPKAVSFVVLLAASQSFAETPTAEYAVQKHTEYNLAATEVEQLHATVAGLEYVLDHPSWAKYMRINVVETLDMDGDGYQEALIGLHTGGNCCPSDYAIVSHRGDDFFTIYADQMTASWDPPEIKQVNNETRVEFVTISAGADNTYMDEVIEQYALRDGHLKRVRQLSNSAMLYAEPQMTSADLAEAQKASDELIVDLDADGEKDAIICDYWARWGSMRCIALSSQHPGNLRFPHSCKRVGVLTTKTNGLFDLACGRNGRLVFNGVNYVEPYQ